MYSDDEADISSQLSDYGSPMPSAGAKSGDLVLPLDLSTPARHTNLVGDEILRLEVELLQGSY